MTDQNKHAPAHASTPSETPPSALCTDCPRETCLEFTVVDYWGNPVTAPTRFELDGRPVQPDTPIRSLRAGPHILKAVDGEDVRQEILNLPHEPMREFPSGYATLFPLSPACRKARESSRTHKALLKTEIWDGVELITKPSPTCQKFTLEMNPGIDYYILMVFLDNHSGTLHGSGHAGVFIIDGQANAGRYAHFGPYENGLGEVEISDPYNNVLRTRNGSFNEETLADLFSNINENYGSGIVSKNACNMKIGLNGPDHGQPPGEKASFSDVAYMSPGFPINGLVAWAAYALPSGSYKVMEKYILEKKEEMQQNIKANINGYEPVSFNCMDFSVAVLESVISVKHPIEDTVIFISSINTKVKHALLQLLLTGYAFIMSVDHPNDHIQYYMEHAHDSGIFDDRQYRGEPEAVSNKPQSSAKKLRHHKKISFFFSHEELKAK